MRNTKCAATNASDVITVQHTIVFYVLRGGALTKCITLMVLKRPSANHLFYFVCKLLSSFPFKRKLC